MEEIIGSTHDESNLTSDQQAIALLKKGNIEGLAALVQHYQVKAVHTALLITCDRQLAEDVVQDAFLRHFLASKEREMVRILGRPSSTIKWWLHAARKRLRQFLEPVGKRVFEKEENSHERESGSTYYQEIGGAKSAGGNC